jgi:hypothetical protein
MSGPPNECHNCGYPAETLRRYGNSPTEHPVMLCDVCYKTFLSHAILWPRDCDVPKLCKSVGYIANMILAEIRKLKEKRGEAK